MTDGGYPKLGILVGSEWLTRASGGTKSVSNPATEELLGEVPLAGKGEIERCLSSAADGFRVWRETPASTRSHVLQGAADILRRRAGEVGRWLTMEEGKTLAEAKLEVESAASNLEWNGRQAERLETESRPHSERGFTPMIQNNPIGPVVALTPWNFPAMVPARKIAPALAAGCSVILKPAEETPATAMAIVDAIREAGAPPGVIQLVCGEPEELSSRLISAPVVRKLSFTGSVPVGKHLARLAADVMKPGIWELGGHGPAIVLDDADIALAAATLARFKSRNAGQVCTAPSRFYVHSAVHDGFVEAFAEELRQLRLGDGLEPDTDVGPLANGRRVAAMERLVSDAVSRGARVVLGGKRRGERGFFFELTVLVDVPETSAILNQEPFGPVSPIVRFDAIDEAVAKANALPYGLSAFVFTRSEKRASELVDALEAGFVQVNCAAPVRADTPMGGVKESGYGYEGGVRGIEEYRVAKLIHHPDRGTS
jgi:succinate-semialdehyde dehydrogenase/glutarate-semialdehyde dehydrogenase